MQLRLDEQHWDKRIFRNIIMDSIDYNDYKIIEMYVKENYPLIYNSPNRNKSFDKVALNKMMDMCKLRGLYRGLTIEEINKQVQLSRDMSYWIKMEDGTYWFKSDEAEDWRFSIPIIKSPVSNLYWNGVKAQYIRFKDDSGFNKLGRKAQKALDEGERGPIVYCSLKGKRYEDFWMNEIKYCETRYTTNSLILPGRLYYYLNYGVIPSFKFNDAKEEVRENMNDAGRPSRLPIFSDHLYYLSFEIEASFGTRDNNYDDMFAMCIIKGRRLGLSSFISIGVTHYNYTFMKASRNPVITKQKPHFKAYKSLIKGVFKHIDENTEFKQSRLSKSLEVDKYQAGWKNGSNYAGSLSEISFTAIDKDFQKNVGDYSSATIYEETGANDVLDKVISSAQPLVYSGSVRSAPEFAIGTGGDMNKGTKAVYSLFFNPGRYKFKIYQNIYGGLSSTCGYFISSTWFRLGTYNGYKMFDEYGNSWQGLAKHDLMDSYRIWVVDDKSMNNIAYYPLYPSLAFLQTGDEKFDMLLLQEQMDDVFAKYQEGYYNEMIGRYNYIGGKYVFANVDKNELITEYPLKNRSTKGAILKIEEPSGMTDDKIVENILFIDAYDQDKSKTSKSLGAAIVYNRLLKKPVAVFVSRETVTGFYEQVAGLAVEYNALTSFDSNTPGVHNYFISNALAHLLLPTPYIKGSRSERKYGLPMTTPTITLGQSLLVDYFNSVDRELGINKTSLIEITYLLQELPYMNSQNTDITVAFYGALVIDYYLSNGEKLYDELNKSTDTDKVEEYEIDGIISNLIGECVL